jgi:hypothetical protein
VQSSAPVTLSGTNNLFNPVTWQRRGDNRPEKISTGAEVGPEALQIIEIKPLYFRISFVGQTESAGVTQYSFRIQREGAAQSRERAPITRSFTAVGVQNAGLLLREMRPAEQPTEFLFESLDDKTQVTVETGKDFERAMGYLVTLRYEPENRLHRDKRVGDTLSLDGETYKVVATTESSITIEAPNRKRTTITTLIAPETNSP